MGKVHAASLRTKEVIQSSLRARTYASDTFSKVLGLSTTVVTEIRAGIVNRCEIVGDELQGDVDGEIWDVGRCSFAMQRGSLRTLSAHVHPLFSLARIIAPYNCSYGNGTVEYSIVFCNGESACVTSVKYCRTAIEGVCSKFFEYTYSNREIPHARTAKATPDTDVTMNQHAWTSRPAGRQPSVKSSRLLQPKSHLATYVYLGQMKSLLYYRHHGVIVKTTQTLS